MTQSPRRDGTEPTQPPGNSYPGYTDPAYADQAPYGYQAPQYPTQRLPGPGYETNQYDPYATGQYGAHYPAAGPPPPPPREPRSPRWLWVLATVAVLAVVSLVIALVIADSSRQHTVVAPPLSEPTFTTTTRTPTTTRIPTTTRTPTTTSTVPLPAPPAPTPPSEPPAPITEATPEATETVSYEVSGVGRAISIIYVDTGRVLQTEFNVVLPWSKQVELPAPANTFASISVLNVGREVTCTITVNGGEVRRQTGSGLTICAGPG